MKIYTGKVLLLGKLYPCHKEVTKIPAEMTGNRYNNVNLMSRMQKTDGTGRCFAQNEKIKRQSLTNYAKKINHYYKRCYHRN